MVLLDTANKCNSKEFRQNVQSRSRPQTPANVPLGNPTSITAMVAGPAVRPAGSWGMGKGKFQHSISQIVVLKSLK